MAQVCRACLYTPQLSVLRRLNVSVDCCDMLLHLARYPGHVMPEIVQSESFVLFFYAFFFCHASIPENINCKYNTTQCEYYAKNMIHKWFAKSLYFAKNICKIHSIETPKHWRIDTNRIASRNLVNHSADVSHTYCRKSWKECAVRNWLESMAVSFMKLASKRVFWSGALPASQNWLSSKRSARYRSTKRVSLWNSGQNRVIRRVA